MQKERVYKANEITKAINYNKDAINALSGLCEEDKDSDTISLFSKYPDAIYEIPKRIIFDRSEIEEIIKNKKYRIAKLERELEEL